MKILVIGGTGVIGAPLVNVLSENIENQIDVLVRFPKPDKENIHYIGGNAFDIALVKLILNFDRAM